MSATNDDHGRRDEFILNKDGDRIHPMGKELLEDVIERPELHESEDSGSLRDLHRIFQQAGYENLDNAGEVTVGWGRKVDKGRTKTSCILLRGSSIVAVTMGSKGSYALGVQIADVNNLTKEDLQKIRENDMLQVLERNHTIGPRARRELDRLLREVNAAEALPAITDVVAQKRSLFDRLFRRKKK